MLKKLAIGLFLMLLVPSCDDDDPNVVSDLEKSGVLGTWELQSRSYDGITPLIVWVGYTLTLEEDQKSDDMIGKFLSVSPGDETEGVFELRPMAETIRFEFGSRTLTYAYEVQDKALIFNYEEDGVDINEIWILMEPNP